MRTRSRSNRNTTIVQIKATNSREKWKMWITTACAAHIRRIKCRCVVFVSSFAVSPTLAFCNFFSLGVRLVGSAVVQLGYDVNIYYPSTNFLSRVSSLHFICIFSLISRRFGSHMVHFSHFVPKLKVIALPLVSMWWFLNAHSHILFRQYRYHIHQFQSGNHHDYMAFELSFYFFPYFSVLSHKSHECPMLHLLIVQHWFAMQFEEFPLTLTLQASHYVYCLFDT